MPVDEDGFLDGRVPIQRVLADAKPGDLLSLAAAAEARALVVLGEPGLGKSTALRTIAEGLRASGAELAWLDGANLAEETFAEELGAHLARLPLADAPRCPPGHALTVVLDALDESAMVRRFPRRLRDAVASRDVSSLRVIVGCRTADVPVDLADTLEQLFHQGMIFADLAPLRRSDAVHLASSLDVDGEQLIAAAINLGAGSLAAIPLTLGLLVRDFLDDATLSISAQELFARGVVTLLDTYTVPSGSVSPSTVDQRRAVAERIAVVMLLSGKRTVFVGRDLDVGKQDLRASDISDGCERTASGPFAVTPSLVRETLSTPLFAGRGPDRHAFVHASQAAFLAACYLRRHEPRVPRRQLEGILLVAAPDASKTIPVPLRELAAWLASLDPVTGTWLAQTDPASMVGHESYLESDELRETVVNALFASAAEFELGDRRWTSGINLAHPRLATQVLVVLCQFETQPADWTDFARCRIALRLAKHGTSPELTERLLRIAESSDWNSHLGSLAAEAALAGDRAVAAEHLSGLLRRLGDADFARTRDPDDELKGHLLDGLWPEHITTTDVLRVLKPRQSGLLGMYWSFLRSFAEHLDDGDLALVLRWAATRAQRDGDAQAEAEPEEPEEDPLGDERPIGGVDALLAESLVERALGSAEALELMADAAVLTWPRLDRYEHPTLPAALEEAITLEPTEHARRAFAEALLRHKAGTRAQPHAYVWHLVGGWRRRAVRQSEGERPARSALLDAGDFPWAVERALELERSEPGLAGAMAQLAGYLFNPHDLSAVEIASRQAGSIVWNFVSHWFDAVPLNSELADRLRERHSLTRAREAPEERTEPVEGAFREGLMRQIDAVLGGDWTQFWRLAWNLQFPPDSGRGRVQTGDRLLAFPAISLLPASEQPRFVACAREFLMNEDDHAQEWLGTDEYDRRAWAGYLALSLLDDMNDLESVPGERMACWAGAAIWFRSVPSGTGDRGRKSRILARVVESDVDRVAALLLRYVRGELRRGSSASEIEAFDPASVRAVRTAWIDMVIEVHEALLASDQTLGVESVRDRLVSFPSDEARVAAGYAWERMFHRLALADPLAAEALATSWAIAAHEATAKSLAATAIAVLVAIKPDAWRRLAATVQRDHNLGRRVAAAIVDDEHDNGLLAELNEGELGDLYVWLATVFPPETDEPDQIGASWVTPEAQARRWRDGVLTAIANRGTDDAVRVLFGLHEQLPGRITVLSSLIRARVATFATAWMPPTAAEVQSLLQDARRRLVRSGEELALLIQEALQAVQDDLIRMGQLLWDRLGTIDGAPRPWVPKPEAALSAFVAHELELRLQDRGVAVHREVLVKPTDAYGAGDRPDILVEARTRSEDVTDPPVHRVAIEVKGSWNQDVLTAQRDQLAIRYLPECDAGVGLYVVGWYPLDLWDRADYRRARVAMRTSEELLAELVSQADQIGKTTAFRVTPVVIAIPRPAPNGPADSG